VTERIASQEADSESSEEITGSNQRLRSCAQSAQADPKKKKKKTGTDMLFAVDHRPNG
jgi:hypothetical protein